MYSLTLFLRNNRHRCVSHQNTAWISYSIESFRFFIVKWLLMRSHCVYFESILIWIFNGQLSIPFSLLSECQSTLNPNGFFPIHYAFFLSQAIAALLFKLSRLGRVHNGFLPIYIQWSPFCTDCNDFSEPREVFLLGYISFLWNTPATRAF